MTTVHQTAGRLRLKFPELKNDVPLCRAVEEAIRGLPTVRLAQTNPVTGSLLVHYDARGAQQVALLDSIRNLLSATFGLTATTRRSAGSAVAGPANSTPMMDRMADMVIDKIVQHAALALLGILI